jgi:hypothetical protein
MYFYSLSFYSSLIQALFVLFISFLPALIFAGLESQKNKHYTFEVNSTEEVNPCGNKYNLGSLLFVQGDLIEPKGEAHPLSLRFNMRDKSGRVMIYNTGTCFDILTEEDFAILRGLVGESDFEKKMADSISQVSYLCEGKSGETTQQKLLVNWDTSGEKLTDMGYDPRKYYPHCECKDSIKLPELSFYNGRLSIDFLAALACLVLEAQDQGEFTGATKEAEKPRRSRRHKMADESNRYQKEFGEGNSLSLLP